MTGVLQRVRAAANAADRPAFRDEIHTLRGIAMNIGAVRLAGACADKAVLAPGRPNREVRDYAVRLELLVAEVREALPALLCNLRSAGTSRPGSGKTH
jgi:HPt (histidine-containing phosphotransfer) domain-containing protein